MANVLELRIESTLDRAGLDAARQGVAEIQGATSTAAGAMQSTAGAASTALRGAGDEAAETASAVRDVGTAATGAARDVNALSSATANAANAASRMGAAASAARTVSTSAQGAGRAIAGVGTAATAAGNEAVSSLNLMSMGANVLTGNVMGTIQASTELAGHFKGISMIKFSAVALAVAGIATAWKWVTDKIKEYNREMAKSRAEEVADSMKRLRDRYNDVTKAAERYAAAQARIAQNVDAFQELGFDRRRLSNAQRRENAAGESALLGTPDRSASFEAVDQDINNAERLYQAKVAAGRAAQEAVATEKEYKATLTATNSQIRALKDLRSQRSAMERQAAHGSDGQKAYAEGMLKSLNAEISLMEAAVKEGRAKTETLRLAKQQGRVEEELSKRRVEMVQADIELTNQARERTRLAEFQAQREAARVSVADAVAAAETEVAAARQRLAQAEKNEEIRERTRELEKQAQLLDKQAGEAKKLLGFLKASPNRERALEKREKEERRQRQREERNLRRQRQREDRDIDRLADRAGGKAIIDPATGKLIIAGRDGDDLTHRLSKRDRERFARLAKIREAEEAQNNGKANAARQQIADMNNPQEAAKALQALQTAEKGLETAADALARFDEETASGLQDVQAEIAQWKEGANAAIREAGERSNQVITQLTAATQAQTSTLAQLLTAV